MEIQNVTFAKQHESLIASGFREMRKSVVKVRGT